MGLPKTLKNFILFIDGDNYAGEVPETTLPKLGIVTEEYRAGGMLGNVDLDMGLEKLEMSFKAGGLLTSVLRQFGIANLSGVQLRFAGAYQADDTGDVMSAELVARGRHKEIDYGTAKVGEKTEMSVSSTLTYLKWTIDGNVEIEIDVLNNVFLVNGVDRMAEIRLALGQ